MPHHRPRRLDHIQGIGVDKMGNLADAASEQDYLRLENLDVDIPPDHEALKHSELAVRQDQNNSYLPFTGQAHLREVAAEHVSRLSGVQYSGQSNCTISAGGLSGILNVLLATVEEGDEVIMTDPTYRGLINRVLLAGGVPKFVPLTFQPGGSWKLDQKALRSAVTKKTSAMLLMSPGMPSGGYFDEQDWRVISELCIAHNLLLINDAAMERLVFDDRPVIHPASFSGMAERTITVGSSAKELRMIGWRVGWIVGPQDIMRDVVAVSMANVVVPVGIAQEAVAIALGRSWAPNPSSESSPRSDMSKNMAEYLAELQARRDIIVSELEGLPVGIPAGGWSLLLRVSDFGIDANEASRRLLNQGVCATSMDGWGGPDAGQYIRFVFSNEPRNRLRGLGAKVRRALETS
ncbi:class I and II aminotransferase [Xylariales sp. PMI_506]|nr:class I and II aminotransferase [Xylariales sp. PMI_506]